ncbi:MAG TPA: NAD-glutamate dehydrogenase [Candidatus Binatia bacterium]|nr:NAD-glutamate dehydrogenase [Candidatus Binatia bacterium]
MNDQSAAPGAELDALLGRLEAQAARRIDGAPQRTLFRKFLRAYYELASTETLKLRTESELFDSALAHFHLARTLAPGEARVEVTPPQDAAAAGSRGFATLRTVVADMPFLYDSAGMAIRAAGASIDWTVHPVLRVVRNEKHELVDVLGTAGSGAGGRAESLIRADFEALPRTEDYAALQADLGRTIAELRVVVEDYQPMRSRVAETVAALDAVPDGAEAADFREVQELLKWLDDGHFTFLGYSEAKVVTAGGQPGFRNNPGAGLGLLRPKARFADTDELIAPRDELSKHATSVRVVVVTKANARSPIHHPDYMDVVSVKHFHKDGSVSSVHRFVGLFANDVYTARATQIPLVRRKLEYVLKRSRLPAESHSGKNLREILQGLPRDELFQSGEDDLFDTCMGIRALRDRHQLRVFTRRDRYGRFFSFLVYLPRDRYSRELRDRIGQELMDICGGASLERQADFLREGLARIHYMVRTPPSTTLALSPAEIEQRLLAATRTWRDVVRELLLKAPGDTAALAARFSDAFPLSYTSTTPPAEAVLDVQALARLSAAAPLLPRLAVSEQGATLKLYSFGKPIALSDVLPTLENFGLRVIWQDPTEVKPKDADAASSLWVQAFAVMLSPGVAPNEAQRAAFESALLASWRGEIENDGLNRLVLAAGMEARQVVALRTILKYLIQTGLPYSQSYMEQLLAEQVPIARLLVKLFELKFDPSLDDRKRKTEELKAAQELDALLDKVATLDGDRVLRAFVAVVRSALRTNYFQKRADGGFKHYVSIKLDPKKVPELPQPLPMFEIFVYAPEVEGIHLRGGKVARGGLRWSDRRQDFRTEVLGLMKAQMVKNSIIVPVGAKGGFVVKRGDPAKREEWLKTGVDCYKTFVRGLLDLTDNRVGDGIVPPAGVVRYDDDDPYLVVAADKGTATFSDIANGLSAEYGFWLGDAFASGGSVGYDHKKMGITAKGAWESVKRHFREAGKNIQEEEFSVAGIGDMSGDVFGNGMLLSRRIRLIAAFDHRHIFLDPEPDTEKSFRERERMFALPRSSWDDYDKSLIGKGGGVYPRSAKSIKLSDEAKKALELRKGTYTPNELINAILKAPVDLLWNGGIGTYVKSQYQSHAEVGDRANDAIRVNGRELRCKVVGEGGNLGMTQLGRIEAALHGVRLNTDAIDNSGGVHSSDREVNIKIPLNRLLLEGRLTREKRDPLLARMTGDLARAVLYDSYVQSLCISLLEREAPGRLDEHANLIRTLEKDGLLNRAVEYLPDDESMTERRTRGKGLTRPELAVLVSYAKISLFDSILHSQVPDDPFFERDLLSYFPPELVKTHREHLLRHRLRREIIATILSNAVVNRMGIAFAHRFAEDHGVPRADVLKAYATAHEMFEADRYWSAIQSLDGKVAAQLQFRLFGRAIGLIKHATTWLLNAKLTAQPVGDTIERYRKGIKTVEGLLPEILPPSYRHDWDKAITGMETDGTPKALAHDLANTMAIGSAPDIVDLALDAKVPLAEAAGVYFGVGDKLRILWLLSSIVGLQVQGKWQALARANLRDDSYRLHRLIACRVLTRPGKNAEERIDNWVKENEARVKFGIQRLQELHVAGPLDFLVLAVGVRELRKLSQL